MGISIAQLSVRLSANVTAFSAGMAAAARPLAAFGGKVAAVGSKVAALTTALGGGALASGATGLGLYAVKLAADAEQARVSFTTMLGSAEKAKALQAEINSFAASTPFSTVDLVDASKKLLAFGVAQDQVIPTMRTLGDLAAGLNIPLGELSEIYGKARVQGRLMAEDISQLTGRGIPVIQQFAKQFGVADGEVKKLVEQGKIGFPHLQKALIDLTANGGQFAGMMAAQSKTVSGLWSTMEDTVSLSLTRVGETITEKLDLRAVIGGVTESVSALADAALPVIEAFIGRMAEGGNLGERAGQLVLSGAELIAKGLAYAIDYSKLLVAGFRLMQAGAAYAIGGLLKSIDYLGSGVVKLLNLLPGVEIQWSATIGAMADGVMDEARRLRTEAGAAFDGFQASDSARTVGRFFDQVRANAAAAKAATEGVGTAAEQLVMKIEQAAAVQNAKVKDTLDKLRQQIAEFGVTDRQKLADQLRKAGASDAQITEATGLQAQLDAMEAAKKRADDLQQAAKSVFDATRNPMEQYESRIGELDAMLKAGAINWDTYGRAVRQAREELEQKAKPDLPEPKAPELLRAGSAAALQFVYDQSRGVQRMTRDEVAKKALDQQVQSARLLDRIERNTRPAAAEDTITISSI